MQTKAFQYTNLEFNTLPGFARDTILALEERNAELLAALNAARHNYIDTRGIAIPEEQNDYPLLVQMDAAIAKAEGK